MVRLLILNFSVLILSGCTFPENKLVKTHSVSENSLKQYPTSILCEILKGKADYQVQSIVYSELEQRKKTCNL